jgi:protein-disulfide isomerase
MNKTVSVFLGFLGLVAIAAVALSLRWQPGTTSQVADDSRIRSYIMSHPEVLIESVARLQAARQGSPDASNSASIAAHHAEIFDDTRSQIAGNPNGDVALVLFFDYRCPYCKQDVAEENAFLKSDPKAKIIYKEFPILGPQSITAARAALASVKQGKYAAFHDAMMASHGTFSDEEILGMAQDVGIDVNRLMADMNGEDVTQTLQANFNLAKALGINGTPAYIVGDRLVGGVATADDFKALVAEARAIQGGPTAQ